MGGAINFATNYVNSQAGGIAWSTYIIFIAFECTGIFYALLLSPTSKVRRPDGHRIPASPDVSWGKEFKALWKHAQTRRVRSHIGKADKTDMAHVPPRLLLLLHRRHLRYLPLPQLLGPISCRVFIDRP